MSERGAWIWGGIALAAVVLAALWSTPTRIERDITTRAQRSLKDAGLGWAAVSASGRDLTLRGRAPDPEARERARRALGAMRGVRHVKDHSATLARPRAATNADQRRRAAASGRSSRPAFGAPLTARSGRVAMTRERCTQLVRALVQRHPIRFVDDTAVLYQSSMRTLDHLSTAMRHCRAARMRIVGRAVAGRPARDAAELARSRAEAVVENLAARGVEPRRMIPGVADPTTHGDVVPAELAIRLEY